MFNGATIIQSLAIVFFVVVGSRLILLGRRTGKAPEKALGAYFFFSGCAYLGWLYPTLHPLDNAMADRLDLATWALYNVGVVPFMFFTRLVFRPNAAWAKWFLIAASLSLSSGLAMWFVQAHDYYSLTNPWFWPQWLGYTIPCVWLSIEALLMHASAKRRARIGLCDRIVANRYLLFGLFGALQTVTCITDIYTARPGGTLSIVADGVDAFIGAVELAGIGLLFLAFFPPTFYQSWISGSATGRAQTVNE